MAKWVEIRKSGDFQEIGKKYEISPVIARLMRNRDIITEEQIQEYLYGEMSTLPSPWLLKDMKKAVTILAEKIREGRSIRIIGDYDIDGVTATYVLLAGLQRLRAKVDTYIPDRVADGYGIHDHLIDRAAEDGIDTILTCDNGIAASKEIQRAKEAGITVVVTDHHEVPFREQDGEREYLLPPADAIVNPKQADCSYPSKNICGAVVAFKLICALYETFGIPGEELEDFTEIIAIATVGDVMDLQGESRIIVKEGLIKLPHTRNVGLQALLYACGLQGKKLSAYHIGFVLGPCINASGRIDTAARSLQLLSCTDPSEAARIAGDLTALNETRKEMTNQGKEVAIRLIEETEIGRDRVLVLYLPDCHESIAGIIAGRIRELYYKPVFVLTNGETFAKGSGRSIEAFSMYEELVKCSDLLEQFGGHPMAAGLSIRQEHIDAFRKRLNENCSLTETDLEEKIQIDMRLPFRMISKPLIEQLSLLEPCGKGNRKPVFAESRLTVLDYRILGKNQNVVKLHLCDLQGLVMEAIYFGDAKTFAEYLQSHKQIAITYYPEINHFQGREELQVTITNYC